MSDTLVLEEEKPEEIAEEKPIDRPKAVVPIVPEDPDHDAMVLSDDPKKESRLGLAIFLVFFVGIVGFGDLGRALNRLLAGFRARVRVFDPWLPPSLLAEVGVTPASLDEVLSESDFVFVVAAVTTENRGFIGANAFARMRPGAAFVLLSRADVVDFEAEVVDADEIAAAAARRRLGLVVQQRDVDGAVAEVYALRVLPVGLADALQAEGLDVELRRLLRVGNGDGDVAQPGLHSFFSCGMTSRPKSSMFLRVRSAGSVANWHRTRRFPNRISLQCCLNTFNTVEGLPQTNSPSSKACSRVTSSNICALAFMTFFSDSREV